MSAQSCGLFRARNNFHELKKIHFFTTNSYWETLDFCLKTIQCRISSRRILKKQKPFLFNYVYGSHKFDRVNEHRDLGVIIAKKTQFQWAYKFDNIKGVSTWICEEILLRSQRYAGFEVTLLCTGSIDNGIL